MSRSDTGPIQDGSNDSGDGTEQRQYQFGGDYVISSSRAPGAWVSATYPVNLTEAQ